MGTVICDRSAGKDKLFRAKPNYRGGTPRFRLPILYFLPMALCLWLAARLGVFLRTRRPLQEDEQADFGVIQAATLTLLALIIGFSFSMATSRYDVRKSYEQAEANAIGTEWVRAGLLPPGGAARVRGLLRRYLDLRIAFYWTRDMTSADQEMSQGQGEGCPYAYISY